MIYGANGYSAGLIIELAKKAGLDPVLAGRNAQAVMELGRRHQLQACAFGLDGSDAAEKCLRDMDVVLNCAGPFSRTAKAMVDACLKTGTVYLDITGEIDVFEMIHRRSQEIAAAGTTAIPGVGFDVVPSDCLAKMLSDKMPGAQTLRLAFHPEGSRFSPGTMKTMVEGFGLGGRVRRAGEIVTVPPAYHVRQIEFRPGQKTTCATIPWGDVATAWYSTGIPDIEVYTSVSDSNLRSLKMMRYTGWLFKLPPVVALAQKQIARTIRGPDQATRDRARTFFWGEVTAHDGRTLSMRMETPEGYSLTAESALACVQRCLRQRPQSGALTPSAAFGAGFVRTLSGVTVHD
jgi:short subunit dehydrogenase-like uncharacterized protein